MFTDVHAGEDVGRPRAHLCGTMTCGTADSNRAGDGRDGGTVGMLRTAGMGDGGVGPWGMVERDGNRSKGVCGGRQSAAGMGVVGNDTARD